MKKFIYFIAGAILSFGATAFAVSNVTFTDEDSFEEWYEGAAVRMYEDDIITGYPDGSFGATNNVNRAELAVILERFQDYSYEVIENHFDSTIDEIVENTLEYADTDYDYRAFIVLSESGLRELGEDLDDEDLEETYGSSELEEITSANLPEGYTAYEIETSGESGYPLFLYFDGEICEEDTCGNQQQWYGPFYRN